MYAQGRFCPVQCVSSFPALQSAKCKGVMSDER